MKNDKLRNKIINVLEVSFLQLEDYYNRAKDYSFLTTVFEEGVLLVGNY